MLAKHQRVVAGADFKTTVRRGKRVTSDHAVVYVFGSQNFANEPLVETDRFGFIVSKAVGNAVERNRVRRRLRSLAAEYVSSVARPRAGQVVVLRMLAGAAQLPWSSLRSEVLSSFGRALDIL